jgi:hypothetical protein
MRLEGRSVLLGVIASSREEASPSPLLSFSGIGRANLRVIDSLLRDVGAAPADGLEGPAPQFPFEKTLPLN